MLLLRDGDEKLIKKFQIAYYMVVGSVILLITILSVFTDYTVSCQNDFFSFHWFLIDALDLFQSILITCSAAYLIKHMQNQIEVESGRSKSDASDKSELL